MLTWMQRHKKWLVVTIWISTIAFVGAGFVGWGSYNYGKDEKIIAVVGNREITIQEYQQEYSNMYMQYTRMFGDNFNEELAQQIGLKDAAYNQVIQKNLLLSYADSQGMDVTDEEIAKILLQYNVFLKDGKFDKETYVKVLNQNGLNPKSFEDSLKNSILLEKVQLLFQAKPNSFEISNVSKLVFLEDDIDIKILSLKDVNISIKEDDLKKYWEENKNSFMSEVSYNLDIKEIPLINSNPTDDEINEQYDKFKIDYKFNDGKIKSLQEAKSDIIKDLNEKHTRSEALKIYTKLKKDEEKFDKSIQVLETKLPFSKENIESIIETKEFDIVKPFFENGKFFIIKIAKINPRHILSFEKARPQAMKVYENILKTQKLQEIASSQLKDFKGINFSSVSRESILKPLSKDESLKFLNQLFVSTSKTGIINVGDKVVLYRVNKSNFSKTDKSKDSSVLTYINQIKQTDLMTSLLKKLENTYSIKSSIQSKEK